MYQVLLGTPKDIAILYFAAFLVCFLLYPVAIISMNIITRGAEKWK
ncbi:hypothetical protein ACTFRD_31830 [Bacillus cereus group sp. MYBK249-1]|nr:hypothetical protein [Bacillus thuringiensis]MED3068680.1 hypothetical protein [Bacillus thuringiensis]